jgi:hypothetical protein
LALPSGVAAPRSSEFGITGLLKQLAQDLIGSFFRSLGSWVTTGATWVLGETWRALSATTEPILTGAAFDSEYHVMVLIGVGTVLPLLGLALIQAIAHQDVSGLLRTALLRLPMAILLTGVVIEIVSLGLTATDRASSSLLATGGAPVASLLAHLEAALSTIGGDGATAFGGLLLVAAVAIVSFVLWIELAVRSAGVAVAALFLPLALAGLVWPATSHWARRLGETLAALVLMKLVMAAILALTAGALAASSGGIASVVEGVSLLGLTAASPFALFRLVPMVEAGAVSHLEGVRPASTMKNAAQSMASSGVMSLVGGGAGGAAAPVPAAAAGAAAALGDAGKSLYGTVGAASTAGSSGGGSSAGVSAGSAGGVGGVGGGGIGSASAGSGSSGTGSTGVGSAGVSGGVANGSASAGPSPSGSSPSGSSPSGSGPSGPSSAGLSSGGSGAAGSSSGTALGTAGAGGESASAPPGPLGEAGWTQLQMHNRQADGGDGGR